MPTKKFGWGPRPTAAQPKCETCERWMGWVELLRTWGCGWCGYFLDDVDPVTGEIPEVTDG